METVLSSTAVDELNDMLNNLVGILCSQIRVSMYDALKLDFGQLTALPVRWKSKKTILAVGDWMFDSWGTAFEVRYENSVVLTSEDEWTSNLGSLRVLEGNRLTSIQSLYNFGLSMAFANAYTINVMPTSEDASENLPFWELYYRGDNKVIEAGPDVWSYRPYANKRFQ